MFETATAILDRLAAMGVRVSGLCADSRALARGEVFLAYPGERADGRAYIGRALDAGAAAVLWEREGYAWDESRPAPNLPIDDLRSRAGPLAHEVYGRPSEKLWMIGVTGTNGKTSCSQWIAQGLSAADVGAASRRTAVMGTLGRGFPGALAPDPNTTPDAIVLQKSLAQFVEAGAEACAMEASSIGLDQGRCNGIAFDVAVFTNLTRDHLDYHDSMEAYAAAKMKLFEMPGLAHAVLNLDDVLGVRIARKLSGSGVERIGYSLVPDAGRRGGLERFLEAHDIAFKARGVAFRLVSSWGEADVATRVSGRFNVANLLAVIGALIASGVPFDAAVRRAEAFESVVGRMQTLGGEGEPLVVIDYAHTPDALDKVLVAVAEAAHARGGRLVCVFGCGGERDRGKRPLMAQAASRHADHVVVTSDNPRGESPEAIVADIVPGVSIAHEIIVDRREAIRATVVAAAPGDVIVLAGKGHEPYQEIAGVRHPFSDLDEARRALEERRA